MMHAPETTLEAAVSFLFAMFAFFGICVFFWYLTIVVVSVLAAVVRAVRRVFE